MDDIELPHELTLAVVYTDEELIELEAVVGAGHWCGRTRAYTVPQDLAAFAIALQNFGGAATAGAEIAAGADTGIGLIGLRFYRFDRAGHIACHVRLASGQLRSNHRPEQVFRLSIEVWAEAWAVERFAMQIGQLVQTKAGRALLTLEISVN